MNNDGFSIITVTNRDYCIKNMINNYKRQNYNNKEFIIIINNDNISIDSISNYIGLRSSISIYKLPEIISLGECLNFGVSKSSYNYIAKFDDDDYYGPYYLDEVSNAFTNNTCDVVGKYKTFYYLERYKKLLLKKDGLENNYTNSIMGSTICFKKEIFNKVKFRHISSREDFHFNKDCKNNDFQIYATSCYHHLVFKHDNPNKHTFKSDVNLLLRRCEEIKNNILLDDCLNIVNHAEFL